MFGKEFSGSGDSGLIFFKAPVNRKLNFDEVFMRKILARGFHEEVIPFVARGFHRELIPFVARGCYEET